MVFLRNMMSVPSCKAAISADTAFLLSVAIELFFAAVHDQIWRLSQSL